MIKLLVVVLLGFTVGLCFYQLWQWAVISSFASTALLLIESYVFNRQSRKPGHRSKIAKAFSPTGR